jgi:predicted GNAT family acetyltransferase
MEVVEVADAAQFLRRTERLRAADPVRLNVIGSVATGVAQGRRYDEEHWFVVEDGGEVVAAATWTMPYRLLVGPMPDDAAEALGTHVAGLPEQPPGVIGPVDVAHRVAAAMGRTATQKMREKLLVLGQFSPATGVPGAARPLTEGDIDHAAGWMAQFALDAGVLLPDPRTNVASRLASYVYWEVDGEPVSFAGHAPLVETPSGVVARVGPVYTPAEHRRRGYGSAVTSAVTERLVDDATVVMLYTDAANATSNGVYERLGYRVFDEVVDLDLA